MNKVTGVTFETDDRDGDTLVTIDREQNSHQYEYIGEASFDRLERVVRATMNIVPSFGRTYCITDCFPKTKKESQTKQYEPDPILEMMTSEYDMDPNLIALNPANQIVWPMKLREYARQQREMKNALMVIVNTPHIQAYIKEKDPMAFKQCLEALWIKE